MKRILLLCIAMALISACLKADKNWLSWKGDEEIPYTGGTVIWTPTKDNVRTIPVICSLIFSIYNSDGDCISTEHLQDFHGDWFDIKTSTNSVSIYLAPNPTGNLRELQVGFEDGVVKGGHTIRVVQKCE